MYNITLIRIVSKNPLPYNEYILIKFILKHSNKQKLNPWMLATILLLILFLLHETFEIAKLIY
jgi:hypothetical protein